MESKGVSHRKENGKRTLGVVAICYNEAEDLPGFLDNLLPWVDEIVLVDDGSKDATPTLAAAAGTKVKFLAQPRQEGEYYAQQRNKGIDQAESDWLLHMDIDERVTPQLAKEIRQAINASQYRAYRFRRLNFFLHRPMQGGGWSDWNLVHLAQREVLRFRGMYHEGIDLQVDQSEIGQLHEKMWHLNDDSYLERLRKSANYQSEVAERIRQQKGRLGFHAIWLSFVKEFAYKYFYKKGFRDGTAGLISAFHSASASFRAMALVWDEQNRIPRQQLEREMQERWQSNQSEKLG